MEKVYRSGIRVQEKPLDSTLNRVIELHDSTVVGITTVGNQVILLLRAYIHASKGVPARDAGSGWIQAAALTFSEAIIEGAVPELPSESGPAQ